MSERAEALEDELRDDLAELEQRFADEEFSSELYRALASNEWRRQDAEGHVALSWSRAEELVNELRARVGYPPLALAQTGREGEVSDLVADELDRLGWRVRPLDTSTHDPDHLASAESPPPKGTGERMAPVDDSDAWEREAHAEAEKNRRRTA